MSSAKEKEDIYDLQRTGDHVTLIPRKTGGYRQALVLGTIRRAGHDVLVLDRRVHDLNTKIPGFSISGALITELATVRQSA
jgi:hypothetical protein